MQFVCLINPFAGKGKGAPTAQVLASRLKSRGHAVRFLETAKDPNEFKARCSGINKEERVICFGGDGTLRNFVDYSQDFYDLAFYGTGTANLNTIEYGIPKDVDSFIQMLEEGHHIDIYPAQTQEGTKFLMMCSFGIDSFILSNVSHRLKMFMGKAAFVLPTIKALLRYSYPSYQLDLDDEASISGSFAIVSRIKHYAGPFVVAPDAHSQADFFQVLVLKDAGFFQTLSFFGRLFAGKLAPSEKVIMQTARKVRIQPKNQSAHCQLDGNHWPEEIMELTISPKQIPLVIPKECTTSINPCPSQIFVTIENMDLYSSVDYT